MAALLNDSPSTGRPFARLVRTAALVALLIVPATAALAQDPSPPANAPSAAAAVRQAGGDDAARPGFFAEPAPIGKTIDFFSRFVKSGGGGEGNSGFYPEFGEMISGAGWISVGPGYRQWLFDDRAVADASAGVSWRLYKAAQARFEFPTLFSSRLAVGTQVRWQDLTQVTYYGEGPESLESDRSEYRLQSTNVVGYGVVRPVEWLAITGRIGWLVGPSLDTPTGSFQRDNPYTGDVFPEDPVFQLVDQPDYLHGEASVTADTRNQKGYPTRGGLYRAGWFAFADRDSGLFSFDRYEAEAAQFFPLAARRLVFALHGWFVGTQTDEGRMVPFYLLPSLGGSSTLRAYGNYRFHDRNLIDVNAETRVALWEHLDAAVFLDAGNVAPRVRDLNFDRTSYGFGLRVHTERTTFVRLDVANGSEGWHVLFRTTDPFRFSRLNRRTAAIPFVP